MKLLEGFGSFTRGHWDTGGVGTRSGQFVGGSDLI